MLDVFFEFTENDSQPEQNHRVKYIFAPNSSSLYLPRVLEQFQCPGQYEDKAFKHCDGKVYRETVCQKKLPGLWNRRRFWTDSSRFRY